MPLYESELATKAKAEIFFTGLTLLGNESDKIDEIGTSLAYSLRDNPNLMQEVSVHCSGCERCAEVIGMVGDKIAEVKKRHQNYQNSPQHLKDFASLALIVTFRHIRRDNEIPGLADALKLPSLTTLTRLPF